MQVPGSSRFFAELRALTAELGEIIDGDLERPVPTCPEWTLGHLAAHVGRGHRWAAQIVATRSAVAIPMREVVDGKLPEDPARHAPWLNAAADLVIDAVTAAGDEPVWTFTGMRPAGFWARRRTHEAAVHLADAQLATGRKVTLAPGLAADGVDEWLAIIADGSTGTTELARARAQGCAETARACIFTRPTRGWAAPASGWSHARLPASPCSPATAKRTSRSAAPQPACCWH